MTGTPMLKLSRKTVLALEAVLADAVAELVLMQRSPLLHDDRPQRRLHAEPRPQLLEEHHVVLEGDGSHVRTIRGRIMPSRCALGRSVD